MVFLAVQGNAGKLDFCLYNNTELNNKVYFFLLAWSHFLMHLIYFIIYAKCF